MVTHHDLRGQMLRVVLRQQEAIEVIVPERREDPMLMLDQETKTIVQVEVRGPRHDQALHAEPTVLITTQGRRGAPVPIAVVPQQGVHRDMEPTAVRVVINPIVEPHLEVATTPNHVVVEREAREAIVVQGVRVETTEAREAVRVAQAEAMVALGVAQEARAATEALVEVALPLEDLLQVEVEAAEGKEHNYISR